MTSDLTSFLDERIAAGDFPGAVVCARGGGREALVARGHAVLVPERIPALPGTIFDLASLTKVLSTTLLVALELEAGALTLDDPVSTHFEEFRHRHVTLRHLLTHTSGLPKWRPLYLEAGDPARVPAVIAGLPLEYEPGTRVVYSDPNFIALGIVLERVTGLALDRLFDERIARPLGLARTGFRPDPSLRPEIAASETGNAYEREMCGESGDAFQDWRTGIIWGEVHDGNAHFLGGVAGHAGLFGTAGETATIAGQFLSGSRLLHDPAIFAQFRDNLTPGLEEHRSIGFQLASTPDSAAGPSLPPDAFGHLGFTGTSLWVDPHRARTVVFLTNRTHPVRRDLPFNEIRRQVNALALDALD